MTFHTTASTLGLCATVLWGIASPALAQSVSADPVHIAAGPQAGVSTEPEPAAAPPLSANVTLTSQYVSRGWRQTWGKPALQGGFDYAHPSGFFAGTWMSSVSNRFIENGTVEWDLYAGYSQTVGDVGYGVTAYYYVYPGAKMAFADVRYDYGEIVPSISYKFLTVKYWLTYTRDYFGFNDETLGTTARTGDRHSRGSGYLDVNANFDLGSGYGLLLHYGQQNVRGFSFANWRDAKIAVSKSFDGGWSATLAFTKAWDKDDLFERYTTGAVDSSGHIDTSNPLKNTVFVSVTRTF